MKFKYSFHSILKYKEQIEETDKIKFAELNKRKTEAVDVLIALEEKLIETRDNFSRKRNKNIHAHKLNDHMFLKIEEQIKEQKKKIQEAEVLCEEQRKKLGISQKERKMFDSLKEKQHIKHTKEIKRLEANEMNEIALQRYCASSSK